MDTVLTGTFQLIFLNSTDGMLVFWAQSKYKQQMWTKYLIVIISACVISCFC